MVMAMGKSTRSARVWARKLYAATCLLIDTLREPSAKVYLRIQAQAIEDMH